MGRAVYNISHTSLKRWLTNERTNRLTKRGVELPSTRLSIRNASCATTCPRFCSLRVCFVSLHRHDAQSSLGVMPSNRQLSFSKYFHNQILARSLTKWWKTEKPILWQIHWRSHKWRGHRYHHRRRAVTSPILYNHNEICTRSLTKGWKTEKPILWQIHWRSHEWRSEANLNSQDFTFGRKFIDDVAGLKYWRPDANLTSWDLEFGSDFIDEVASLRYWRPDGILVFWD